MQEPFKVSVNAQYDFDIHPETVQALDLVAQPDGGFHVLWNGASYHAELLEFDYQRHELVLLVNGSKFRIHIADRYDRLIKDLGLNVASQQKANQVKAPMPGLILQVAAAAGQQVQKGDTLLILEAMKMENVIKAAADGIVKKVHVAQGAAVEKGFLLIEME